MDGPHFAPPLISSCSWPFSAPTKMQLSERHAVNTLTHDSCFCFSEDFRLWPLGWRQWSGPWHVPVPPLSYAVGQWASFPRTPTFWHLHCCLFLSPAFSKTFTLCVFTDVYFPHIRDKEPGGAQPLGLVGGRGVCGMPKRSLPTLREAPGAEAGSGPCSRSPTQGQTRYLPFAWTLDYQVLSLEGQLVN